MKRWGAIVVAACLLLASGQLNAVAQVATPQLSGATLLLPMTGADPVQGGAIVVSDTELFDPDGGWALVDANQPNQELLLYEGLDPQQGYLVAVHRFTPGPHDPGTFVAAIDPIALSTVEGSSLAPATVSAVDLIQTPTISIDSLEGFQLTGGLGLVDPGTPNQALVAYSTLDVLAGALVGVSGPGLTSVQSGSSVLAVALEDLFPIVVDPDPRDVDPGPVGPVTVDPPPVGGTDLDPLVPDPAPTTIDPGPVGGTDLDPLVPDPAPTTIDPGPVGGTDLDPLVPDPGPYTVDPPAVGGTDLDPLIPDPGPYTVDPPPVGGVDLDPVVPDPGPITVDPPGVGPYDLRATIEAVRQAVGPLTVDPPPVGGYDVGALLQALSQVFEPITVDPPPVGGQNINITPIDPVTVDPPPVGGIYVRPDYTGPVCVPLGDVIAYLEQVIAGIDVGPTIQQLQQIVANLKQTVDEIDLSPTIQLLQQVIADLQQTIGEIDLSPTIQRLQEAVASLEQVIGEIDVGPTIQQLQETIASLEQVIGQIDVGPTLQSLRDALDQLIGGVDPGATIDQVLGTINVGELTALIDRVLDLIVVRELPTLPPIALSNSAMSAQDAAFALALLGVGLSSTSAMSAGEIGNLCVDPNQVGDIYIPVVDLQPITVYPPAPCNFIGSLICPVPTVDLPPRTVQIPNPCYQVGSMICIVPRVDPPPTTVYPPNPCDQVGSMVCQVPRVDPTPVTIDPRDPCAQTNPGDPGNIDPCYVPVVDLGPTTIDPADPCAAPGPALVSSTDPCSVPVVDLGPTTIDPADPCAAPGPALVSSTDPCYIPILDAPPVTVDLIDPCIFANTASPGDPCYVPIVDIPPVTVDPPDPCEGLSSSDPCVLPSIDPSPVTIDVPDACTSTPGMDHCSTQPIDLPPVSIGGADACAAVETAGGSCAIDPPAIVVQPSPDACQLVPLDAAGRVLPTDCDKEVPLDEDELLRQLEEPTNQLCEGLLVIPGTDLCTHGPDPVPLVAGVIDSAGQVVAEGPPPLPPAAPSGLSATASSHSSIDLQWNDTSDNEDGFRIERATSSGGPFSQVAEVPAGVTAFRDTGLQPATSYFYRVASYNRSWQSDYTNEASATTYPPPPPPSAPTNLGAGTVSASEISLSWSDNASNEEGFSIERSSTSSGPFSEVARTGPNTSSFTDWGLSPSTEYFYRVSAYNLGGQSAYSNNASASTAAQQAPPPWAPSSLAAAVTGSDRISLSWTDNSGDETGFKVERSTSGAGFVEIATLASNSANYDDTGLSPASYAYRVRAVNGSGPSEYSNVASATLSAGDPGPDPTPTSTPTSPPVSAYDEPGYDEATDGDYQASVSEGYDPAGTFAAEEAAKNNDDPLCKGDGTSGPRVQGLYVIGKDQTSRYLSIRSTLRGYAHQVDRLFVKSSADNNRRHVRFVCSSDRIAIRKVVVPANKDNNFSALFDYFRNDPDNLNLNKGNRKYMIWVDRVVPSNYCGLGSMYNDDSPNSPTYVNANESGPSYGSVFVIQCAGNQGHSEGHELGHNIGAVQPTAPHGTADDPNTGSKENPKVEGGHCWEEYDVMCYDDHKLNSDDPQDKDRVYTTEGMKNIIYPCRPESTFEYLLDCRRNDYYNTSTNVDGWLGSHWNTADSRFLIPNTGATWLDCEPETESVTRGTQAAVTCTAMNGAGQRVVGARIDLEITGANDPDSADSRTSPDKSCRTGKDGTCTMQHTGNAVGVSTYRAWLDGDGKNSTVGADGAEGQAENSTPGNRSERDNTDVVTKTWV